MPHLTHVHRLRVRKAGREWSATCECGWRWISRWWRVALRQGCAHIDNHRQVAA